MSGVKHTPGPWRIVRTDGKGHEAPDGDAFWVQAGGYGWVGDSYMSSCIGQEDSAEANARLIAAAPDLLEALMTARETIRALHGPNQWDIYDRCSPEMKAINAAIARATGDRPEKGGAL